jgi:predicted nuclease with RNAse H fold
MTPLPRDPEISGRRLDVSLGIDLASQNSKTAACLIEWGTSSAKASEPQLGAATDNELEWLVKLCKETGWVGIDAPFGWPAPMVQAVTGWAGGEPWPATSPRDLRLRLTDQAVCDETGVTPLSVSSDRIAIVAWRCAQLLTLLADGSTQLDRGGADGVFEVYPGAALTCWGLVRAGYKSRGNAEAKLGHREARSKLIDELARRAPWLDLSAAAEACVASDDALDALLAALVARAAGRGKTVQPPDDDRHARVLREGWIHLPKPGTLEQLL